MKQSLHIPILVLIFLYIMQIAYGQENKEIDVFKYDIESLLPPLEILIDSAIANNPSIRSFDLQTRIKEYKLKADRTLWIKNLGLQTDVRYGTINNFSSNTGDGQIPSLSVIQSNSLNYGVGAFIKLPIYEVLSRKNMIRSDKFEIEQAQYLSKTQSNELRQLVIRQFNDLLLKSRLLKIKLKYAETEKVNMLMADKEFHNGVLTLSEYLRVSDSFARSEADLEGVKMDLRTAYMILEVIVGMKFNIKV